MSATASSSFHLLDERIQRFIWAEGWESLRDAQETAIPLIVKGDRDVIVAAATAAGKTEAAFLPALTHLVQADTPGLAVYISPLKALINDQFGRLDRLCEQLEVPVWPWHGDISASSKSRFLSQRRGVLLITPESLEAMLCNRGTAIGSTFERLSYLVVDELHAFIGTERGKQLQALMHRIERVVGRRVPRIGLSATLGDMGLAAEFLRPGHGAAVALVESKSSGGELRILVKGYEEPRVVRGEREVEESEPVTPAQIAGHLFKGLRGSNNLVFPNSRREVERYTHLLTRMCEAQQVPNEFWPHHGSLSKEIRAETEAALKQKERPATAICTNTLELGIDIGAVRSVAQIGPPPSVASLRQRLGRSGRRKGEPAVLRGYCVEDALSGQPSIADELRLGTVQMAAMISLLLEGWFEPPSVKGAHLSTLVQQVLSFIAQNGGATIGQLHGLLCAPATPFSVVAKDEFVELIRHLGQKELLVQDSSGVLLHGRIGEKLVNHYTFYAAFTSDEEFRIVAGGTSLGTLPVSQVLTIGQRILFAGRTWKVEDIDEEQKTIHVSRAAGGAPPLFSGGAGRTHTRVRQRMRQLLEGDELPSYLDEVARRFLAEGRANYRARGLSDAYVLDQGREVLLLTWLGDAANEAMACLLRRRGFVAAPAGPGVEVLKGQATLEDIVDVLFDAGLDEVPPLDVLLADTRNLQREKWDWALPDRLLRKAYGSQHLDLEEALGWIRTLPGAGRLGTAGSLATGESLGTVVDPAAPDAGGGIADGPSERLHLAPMEGFAEVRLKQAALDSIGLPQMSYPVPIHVLQGGLADDGHLPLAAMLHGLQVQARPGGAPWRDMEPVMARLASLTSPDDNRAVISASSDAWWLELGPVDLTGRIVTIQRGDHLIAAVTPRDDGRLRVSTYRPLDAKSLEYLLGLGQAAHPVHGVNMRENNWEYALDCSAGNGNHYAAERGEAYLSSWDGGLGTWSDGSSEPEWFAQRTLSPRPAAQVLAEIAAHQEYSIFGETLTGPDSLSRESTSESFANQVSDRQPGQPLDLKARFAGCLLGGAVGDAMGAPVEFLRRSEILAQFGSQGITDYAPAYGSLGAITDDTQMALFTAEGLLRTWVRGATKGIADPSSIVANAYLRWLRTQGERPDRDLEVGADKPGWLFEHRALHSRRAPGSTCLSALRTMSGLGEPALNDSKGCGGVMRVAPAGLYAWHLRSRQTLEEVFALGRDLAALTHGHPTGSLAGGVLAVLVFRLVAGGHLIEAIGDAKGCLRRWPDHEETLRAIEQAETLSQSQSSPIEAIAALGEGWTAEEALAIGLYCALVAGNFKEGVILAVNHDGDSDSTGAIAGHLLGLMHGVQDIPRDWLAPLELRELIVQVADDLACLDTVDPNRLAERYPGY